MSEITRTALMLKCLFFKTFTLFLWFIFDNESEIRREKYLNSVLEFVSYVNVIDKTTAKSPKEGGGGTQ